MIGISIVLCLSMTLDASPALSVPVLELRLVGQVTRIDEAPPLEPLVEVVSDPEGVWPFLANVRIPVGDDGYIGRGTVSRRIVEAGLPARAFRLVGPALVQVERTRP